MKKIIYSLMGFTLLLASCSTIEDRNNLGPILKTSELVFSVSQPVTGSNTIIIHSNSPSSLPYWDWGTGFSNKANDTIYIPFAGTFKMKYTAFCAGGTVTDSVSFTIAKNDDAFFDKNPLWKKLTGGGAGKTWVWATDIPNGKVAGNGPEDCTSPQWWTMTASDGNVSGGIADEVTMNLTGSANFSRKSVDGSIKKGFFGMLPDYSTNGKTFNAFEVIGGPTMPWPTAGKYHVTVINDDELVIHEYKAYNVAMYKRKGFTY